MQIAGIEKDSFQLHNPYFSNRIFHQNHHSPLSHSLSQRGQVASQSVLRIDFEAYFEAVKNLYHETDNPEGTFPLNIAENKLSWSTLKTQMKQLATQHEIPNWVANYTKSTGSPSFREKVARFYSKFLTSRQQIFHTQEKQGYRKKRQVF